MNKPIIIFDLASIAVEIYAYLILYELPKNFKHDEQQLIHGLEFLLFEDARLVIESNINKLIRNHQLLNSNPYYIFSIQFNLDAIALENAINKMMSYRYLTDKINVAMGAETFDIWTLNKQVGYYEFKCEGDFRVLTFEKEHIHNGRYIP